MAEKQSISLSYLEQVFASLRKSGLVISVRGPGGGYLLARAADQITAGQIIMAVDGFDHEAARTTRTRVFDRSEQYPSVQEFWCAMAKEVLVVLDQVSLQDITNGKFLVDQSVPESASQAAE